MHVHVSRRDLFKYAAVGSAAAVGWAAVGSTAVGTTAAHADGLGTLVDYSGGVPSPESISRAGHLGAIRYVSDRRPDAQWMLGKPMARDEADALVESGLEVVSNYQFGKGATSDWKGGYAAGVEHGQRGLELHRAAGGPENRPIYVSIDDNPNAVQFATQIAPYILGWQSVIGAENTGIYANSPTIELATIAGLGQWYWQHNWGTPKGFRHPAAHLHQVRIDKDIIDGIGVDINVVLAPDYGQWSLA
ncbi:MAG: DUF1906 domain-containing protein [Rhodococcus sp. (in: high G+C Gram-positive bacteria)]